MPTVGMALKTRTFGEGLSPAEHHRTYLPDSACDVACAASFRSAQQPRRPEWSNHRLPSLLCCEGLCGGFTGLLTSVGGDLLCE